MSMVTSCPECTTTFRISPEQLKRREGQVRCGKCRTVFNAFKALATMPDDAPADASAPAPSTASAAVSALATDATPQISLDIGATPPLAGGQEADSTRASSRTVRTRRAWRAAVVLLACLLLLQGAFALRDRLSAAVPGLRPLFEAMCSIGGCTVSPPKRSEQLAIESSDLQASPARPNVIVLTASLRNRGTTLVAHPALELTLTNAQDQALARRIFLPTDYLRQPQDAQRGMAALAEVNVRIELDTGDLRPAGYRLFLFYP